GERLVTLAQAADRVRQPQRMLRNLWLATWRDFLPALGLTDAPPAAPEATNASPAQTKAPAASQPSTAVADLLRTRRMQLFRNIRYPHFTNEQFELFVTLARHRGFDPL